MNTDRFFKLSQKTDALYDSIDSVDKAEWIDNRCTTWLRATLENELEQMYVVWYNGLSGDGQPSLFDIGVAQGMARAVDNIVERIQEMLRDEEHTTGGSQDSG